MGKLGYLNTWVESPTELKPNGRMLLAKVLQNKTFKVVINLVPYKARVFNLVSHFHPSLMFGQFVKTGQTQCL